MMEPPAGGADRLSEQEKQKRVALLNLYQHVYGPARPPEVPPEYEPMPLVEAAKMLVEVGDFRAQGQALARLVSARLHLDDRNMDALRLLCTGLFANLSFDETYRELRQIDSQILNSRWEAERQVFLLLERNQIRGASGGGCSLGWSQVTVDHDAQTLVTTVRVELEVFEQFDATRIGRLLHPLLWSTTYPDYFKMSYATDGIPGDFGICQDLHCTPSPAPWGFTADGQFLMEQIDFPTKLQDPFDTLCSYRNVLQVDYGGLANKIDLPVRMDYGLRRSTFTKLLFGTLFEGGAGVNRNTGFSLAEKLPPTDSQGRPNPEGWKWTQTKSVRFRDLTPGDATLPDIPDFGQIMNYTAPATLSVFLETGMEASACP